MRRISVGLVLHVEDDVAAEHEALIAYLESHLLGDGVTGSIVTTEDITDKVVARLEEMRRKRAPETRPPITWASPRDPLLSDPEGRP